MKQEESLKEKYGTDPGLRVPEGYFGDLQKKIMEELPPYQKEPAVPEMTRWQRLKPYVYLAAMFCGIWLMMQLFHTVSQPITMSVDNAPEALVQLLDGENDFDFDDYAVMSAYAPDYILEEEVLDSYDNMADFENDFHALDNN